MDLGEPEENRGTPAPSRGRGPATGLLDLDTLATPSERSGRGRHPGVSALLVALLEEAIGCFLAGVATRDARRRNEAVRAEQWSLSRDSTSLFAFEMVCQALDLDAASLRTEILRQVRAHTAAPERQRRRHEVSRNDRRLEWVAKPRKRSSRRARAAKGNR